MMQQRVPRTEYAPRSHVLIAGALCSTIRDPAHADYCLGRIRREVEGQEPSVFQRNFLDAVFDLAASGAQEFVVCVETREMPKADLGEIGKELTEAVRRVGFGISYDSREFACLFSESVASVITLIAPMRVTNVIDTRRIQRADRILLFGSPACSADHLQAKQRALSCLRAVKLLLERVHRPELHAIMPDVPGQFRVAVPRHYKGHCERIAKECKLKIRDVGSYGSRML